MSDEQAPGGEIRSWNGRTYLTPDEVAGLFSVEEFEPLARERMLPSNWNYVAGWAGTGATARANRDAFWRHVILTRPLLIARASFPKRRLIVAVFLVLGVLVAGLWLRITERRAFRHASELASWDNNVSRLAGLLRRNPA